jgi:pentatricopeptide repeat protein
LVLYHSSPERVEQQVNLALDSLGRMVKSQQVDHSLPVETFLFPTTRECNAALAAFGDAGDLLRALRLFGKMRKAAMLVQSQTAKSKSSSSSASSSFITSYSSYVSMIQSKWPPSVPVPTLVTYSTLMSRANSLGKPRVALRLWNLMLASSAGDPNGTNQLIPDTRAVNILLNSYAKLEDVDTARTVVDQMRTGSGPDVRVLLVPNLVTFNTLLDACLKAGDLDAALQTKADLDALGLPSDARTYTNLIATVARRTSNAAGQNDPSIAFALLQEMKDRGIKPNGMTYSALIDAAGRCGRSDLALKGLRVMLREKSGPIENEVGAWTAAINACGKSGRVDTAIRLFYAMPKFQVDPNAVTCGCLTDSLLRAGRTADTLGVLRYMKANGIEPTEVMYTSLITRAGGLARVERKKERRSRRFGKNPSYSTADSETKAIEVYTELITSLMESGSKQRASSRGSLTNDKDTLLLKAFLVFQEMKAAGASPDLACYNALLRACARAGDVNRAQNVLKQILASGLEPNDTSWLQLVRAAANIRRSDLAIDIWKQALSYRKRSLLVDEPMILWKPSEESLSVLLIALLQEAATSDSVDSKVSLYGSVLDIFDGLLLGDEKLGLNRIDPNAILESQRTMLLVLQAIVELHKICLDSGKQESLVSIGRSVLQLHCFSEVSKSRLHWDSLAAYRTALSW